MIPQGALIFKKPEDHLHETKDRFISNVFARRAPARLNLKKNVNRFGRREKKASNGNFAVASRFIFPESTGYSTLIQALATEPAIRLIERVHIRTYIAPCNGRPRPAFLFRRAQPPRRARR